MKLLLSVHLPLLPLETLRPSWSDAGAYAVMHLQMVHALSPEAARGGVRIGMRAAGVAAIAPDTILIDRDVEKEARALDAIAMALLQFTPEVTFADDFSILMEVSASLRLFNGAHALCRRVSRSVALLGFTPQMGSGPTAQGAWLLARSARRKQAICRRRTLAMASLHRYLDRLPNELLPSAAAHSEWFAGIGAKHLGALRRLPRTGLMRRTSKVLVDDLDRAYGQAPEMLQWLTVPLHFSERVETFDRIEHAEALMYGATRLILQLVGWLTSLQQAVRMFTLALEHERGRAAIAPTILEIALAEPAWHEAHLVRLLKERLAKVELTAPVIALRLEATRIEPMLPPNASLFPEPGGSPQDYHRLLELLTARLGIDNVLSPAAAQDYRPEFCNAWTPVTEKRSKLDGDEVMSGRPFWLLPKPIPLLMRNERPFYSSPLKLIQGPERLEAGWWDDQTAARDYYVAQGTDATCYWIYLERVKDARWYLHGLYA